MCRMFSRREKALGGMCFPCDGRGSRVVLEHPVCGCVSSALPGSAVLGLQADTMVLGHGDALEQMGC